MAELQGAMTWGVPSSGPAIFPGKLAYYLGSPRHNDPKVSSNDTI